MQPATRGFTIIFSTCRPVVAPGNANCQPWIAPFSWPAHWRPESISTLIRRTKAKFDAWLTHSIDAPIGNGRKTAGPTVTHGWKPESGFLNYRWQGYDEALLLYVLGLGSPTHPLPEESYTAWASTYKWEHCYGQEYLYAGPLFTHQLSHVWIDFRGIQDAFMRGKRHRLF